MTVTLNGLPWIEQCLESLPGIERIVVDHGSSDGTLDLVRERFPDVRPEPVGEQPCLYTTTADESFVLERRDRVVIGSACSGHGFKFAPAIGRRLADLALS